MKKFIFTVLCVAIFFIGLGGLINQVGARFKSDERALALIAQARQAIGGDAAIKNVRSLTIVGRSTQTFNFSGTAKTEEGDLEINMQLPNQFSRSTKYGKETGAEGESFVRKDVNVVIMHKDGETANLTDDGDSKNGQKKFVIIKKDDDRKSELPVASENVRKIIVDKDVKFSGGAHQQNELFRTAFALLLTAPDGSDVSYTYAGEGDVDGNSCDIIQAQPANSSAIKLYLDKSSHLPLMMSYQGMKPMEFRMERDNAKGDVANKDVKVFVRKSDASEAATQEFQIKFSDFRSVGGVQLPYKWIQTANGQSDQTVDVVNYDVNPANIADKFTRAPQKIMLRTEKPH